MVPPESETQPTEVDYEALLRPRTLAERLVDPTHPERLLVPVAETRELLGGISTFYTYELMARGELKSVSLGRRRRVVRASIDALVKRLAAESV